MSDGEWLGRQVFGNWVVKELVGTGSYGSVYKIEREEFDHIYTAALKIIDIDALTEGAETDSHGYTYQQVVELVKEIMLMDRLKGNSHIVSYEDHLVTEKANKKGWNIFIKMEFLTPMNNYVMQAGLTVAHVVTLGIHISQALELCSSTQIIHRDIKPQNIFVSQHGDFKLGDFGIAKQLERDIMVQSKQGTFAYMAPEVYLGKPYDETADIYSLGLVLYRLLNDNRTPFLPYYPEAVTYDNQKRALEDRMSGLPIPPPRIAIEQLTKIIFKACAFGAENRYRSAQEMRVDLEKIEIRELQNFRLTAGNMDINEAGSSRLFGGESSFAIINSIPEDGGPSNNNEVWGIRKSVRQEAGKELIKDLKHQTKRQPTQQPKHQTNQQSKQQDHLFGTPTNAGNLGADEKNKNISLDSRIKHITNKDLAILKDSFLWNSLDFMFKPLYKLSSRKGKKFSAMEIILIILLVLQILTDLMIMNL